MRDAILTWIWRVEYIVSLLIAFIPFFIPMKKRKKAILIASFGFVFLLIVWIGRRIFGQYSETNLVRILYYFVAYSILYLIIFFTLEVDYKQCVFLFVGVICLQHCAYKLNYFIIALIDYNLRHTFYYFIIQAIVLMVVATMFYFVFTRKLKDASINSASTLSIITAAIAIITTIFVSYFTQTQLSTNEDKYTLALLQIYGIILPIFYVAILFQNMSYLNSKNEAEILAIISSKDKERYELAKTTMDQINIKYHDLKHALKEEKINENDKEEIEETITNYSSIIQSGNHTLDILLYEKKMKGESKNVHIISIVDGTLLDFMKLNHLYSMLSNLLENAIESAEQLTDEDKKNVRLSISKNRGSVVINIENHTINNPSFINGLPLTTKKNKLHHGFGLRSVRDIVNRYSGFLSVSLEEDVFKVKIVFPVLNS